MCRKHINFAWGKYKKGIAMHKLFNLIMAQVYWRWPHCLFCKILWNGTSYAWATKRLSHQPSEPAYYILDWRISCLAEACLMPRQTSFRDPSLNFEGPVANVLYPVGFGTWHFSHLFVGKFKKNCSCLFALKSWLN